MLEYHKKLLMTASEQVYVPTESTALGLGSSGLPNYNFYTVGAGTLTKKTESGTGFTASQMADVDLSQQDDFAVGINQTTSAFDSYDIAASTFTAGNAIPNQQAWSGGGSCAINPKDGTIVMGTDSGGPHVYSRNSGTGNYTDITTSSGFAALSINEVITDMYWSGDGSRLVMVGTYVYLLAWNGATFTVLVGSSDGLTGKYHCTISADGVHFAATASSGTFNWYKYDGSLTTLTNPSGLPTDCQGLDMNYDGNLLVIASNTAPYLTAFTMNLSTDTLTLITPTPFSAAPAGLTYRVKFSRRGAYLAAAVFNTTNLVF